jgi:hypothetical protein
MQTAFGDRTARKNLIANKPDVFILPSINPSEKKAVTPRISHATMVPRVFIDDEKVPFEFEIRHSTTTNKINERYGAYKTVGGSELQVPASSLLDGTVSDLIMSSHKIKKTTAGVR